MASSPLIRPAEYGAIATFCAEEVGRQYAGYGDCKVAAQAVGWMIDAWLYALDRARLKKPLTVAMIEEWGRRVEPLANIGGFRTKRIGISRGGIVTPIGCEPWEIHRHLGHLMNLIETAGASPEEAYRYFEESAHPFSDGNGRAGKILLNYLKGTLLAPVMPPNFFGCSNP